METGFSGFEEINRAVYDPQRVTVPQMEEWLKRSGTYVRTLEPAGDVSEDRKKPGANP